MILASVFMTVAIVFHFYAFCLESLLWGKPLAQKTFRVTEAQSEAMKLMAFNQGFYNLFLSIQGILGLVLVGLDSSWGAPLFCYSALSMMGAGIVLFVSERKLLRAALMQASPPFFALVSYYLF